MWARGFGLLEWINGMFLHVRQGGFCFFKGSRFERGFRREAVLSEGSGEFLPVDFSSADFHVRVNFPCCRSGAGTLCLRLTWLSSL